MWIDVQSVKHLEQHKLEITFVDGFVGVVDIDSIVDAYDGVFEPLRDESYFAKVLVNQELGTIAWPNGADLCPDVLYAQALEASKKIN